MTDGALFGLAAEVSAFPRLCVQTVLFSTSSGVSSLAGLYAVGIEFPFATCLWLASTEGNEFRLVWFHPGPKAAQVTGLPFSVGRVVQKTWVS